MDTTTPLGLWFNTQHLILVFKTIDPFLLLVHEVGPPKSV